MVKVSQWVDDGRTLVWRRQKEREISRLLCSAILSCPCPSLLLSLSLHIDFLTFPFFAFHVWPVVPSKVIFLSRLSRYFAPFRFLSFLCFCSLLHLQPTLSILNTSPNHPSYSRSSPFIHFSLPLLFGDLWSEWKIVGVVCHRCRVVVVFAVFFCLLCLCFYCTRM